MNRRGDCLICVHPERQAIDVELCRGESPREIAKRYGMRTHITVWRHKRKHLPDETAQAVRRAQDETRREVRAELQPSIVLDALWTLYRRLGTCCRPQALQILDELERTYDLSQRMESADPGAGPGRVDRPLHPEKRTEPRLRVI